MLYLPHSSLCEKTEIMIIHVVVWLLLQVCSEFKTPRAIAAQHLPARASLLPYLSTVLLKWAGGGDALSYLGTDPATEQKGTQEKLKRYFPSWHIAYYFNYAYTLRCHNVPGTTLDSKEIIYKVYPSGVIWKLWNNVNYMLSNSRSSTENNLA